MISKSLEELAPGDKLIRKSDNYPYDIKEIFIEDYKEDLNFCFWGFCVKKKGMRKFFKLDDKGKFIISE